MGHGPHPPIPNPQSPIPNPQSPCNNRNKYLKIILYTIYFFNNIKKIILLDKKWQYSKDFQFLL
jgi:hypothetical protein